jgi:hypothetical protein
LEKYDAFATSGSVFKAELKNKFGLKYLPKLLDLLEIDYGILESRHDLQDWV